MWNKLFWTFCGMIIIAVCFCIMFFPGESLLNHWLNIGQSDALSPTGVFNFFLVFILTIVWWLVCGLIAYILLIGISYQDYSNKQNLWQICIGPILLSVVLLALLWVGFWGLFHQKSLQGQ